MVDMEGIVAGRGRGVKAAGHRNVVLECSIVKHAWSPFIALFLLGCGRHAEMLSQEACVVESRIPSLEGGWVLSKEWTPYMGVAIEFGKDGTFRCWDYSDVVLSDALFPQKPDYPITGAWTWNGAVIELNSKDSAFLHDTHWHVFRYHGEVSLLPEYARKWQVEDGEVHSDRLLFRIPNFDPSQPFANRK